MYITMSKVVDKNDACDLGINHILCIHTAHGTPSGQGAPALFNVYVTIYLRHPPLMAVH